MQLKDPKLFRQQGYIDGAWADADNGQTINVTNPATGDVIGTMPKMGAAETRRAIEAADRRCRPGAHCRQGARQHPAQVVRTDDGQPGRPGR